MFTFPFAEYLVSIFPNFGYASILSIRCAELPSKRVSGLTRRFLNVTSFSLIFIYQVCAFRRTLADRPWNKPLALLARLKIQMPIRPSLSCYACLPICIYAFYTLEPRSTDSTMTALLSAYIAQHSRGVRGVLDHERADPKT